MVPRPGWAAHGVRLLFAGGAMVAAIHLLARHAGVWMEGALMARIGWLTVIVLAGLAIYALVLLILGLRPRHLRR